MDGPIRTFKRHVLSGQPIFADDTPVKVLAPGNGKTKTARFGVYDRDERPWGCDVPPAGWYQFTPDRKGIRPSEHLKDYKGWMHADGYAGSEELYRSGRIKEAAAWPTSGASSSMCSNPKARMLLNKPSSASLSSMLSRRKPVDHDQNGVHSYGKQKPSPFLMIWKTGCKANCPSFLAKRLWPKPSDTHSPV